MASPTEGLLIDPFDFYDDRWPLVTAGEVRPTNLVPVIAPNRSGAKTVCSEREWLVQIPADFCSVTTSEPPSRRMQ